jgi:3,4-dihydroxy-2-butanone 4-phosphate synthase
LRRAGTLRKLCLRKPLFLSDFTQPGHVYIIPMRYICAQHQGGMPISIAC